MMTPETDGRHRVKRDGDKDLLFHGDLVAEVDDRSTMDEVKTRFNHLRLFRTRAGKYVISRILTQTEPGRFGFRQAWVAKNPREVFDRLVLNGGIGRLGRLDKLLLESASTRIPEFRSTLTEEVE